MTAEGRMLLRAFSQLGVIDTMCHLGTWPYRLTASADADGLRAYARRHGLRSLWVSHLSALFGFDTHTGNRAALTECAGDELFRVFAVIDPSEADWRSELAWAADAGAFGVRVAPGFHHYPVPLVAEVIDAAATHGMSVQLIARMDDARVRHPSCLARDLDVHDIADLVRSRPEHPLVISGLNAADWTELSRHLSDAVPETVRLDLWHVNGPTGIVDRLDPARWVFGSGLPVQTPEATMLQMMASDLPPDALRTITTPRL
ncbi:hypothetical protein ACTU6U_13255 [Microbacterium sp. A196]|uniref:hypothetical protein n=1 Tax=Microbacterium sp. A196 TaxID=3457320 RepID=UPI003FD2BBC0